MIEDEFRSTMAGLGCDAAHTDAYWLEIEKQYTARSRYYHSLDHLDHMMVQLQIVKEHIKQWSAVVLAVAYHDLIYNPLRSNNEARSADIAVDRLKSVDLRLDIIESVHRHIIASASHMLTADQDTNYFLDADISVLGASRDLYRQYAENVRKEYRYYPDLVYKPGRKKVLRHFLGMDRIFKTDYFCHSFELQARENLQWEQEHY